MWIPKIRFKRYVVSILLILALSAVCYGLLDDNYHTVVKGRIYRSAQPSPLALEKYIQNNKIKTIINLRGRQEGKEWYQEERAVAKSYGVELYDIEFSAFKLPQISKLDTIVKILQNSERPIFIHCRGGSHRSGLISALALAIELDSPIPLLKKQFSWRYFVLPFPRSTGDLFFASYEERLTRVHETHSRKNLLDWIKDGYVDSKGNLEYYIDTIEEVIFKETFAGIHQKATIRLSGGDISIVGWAFDARSKLPAKNLHLIIDGRTTTKVQYNQVRPDVAKHFGLADKYYNNIKLGWIAKFSSEDLSTGCHNISLKYVKSKSEQLNIRTNYKFCIEE
jgi:protein tyrosine phosphatase (PTP) superfamily phosphohydrolase (DUF442 family)